MQLKAILRVGHCTLCAPCVDGNLELNLSSKIKRKERFSLTSNQGLNLEL
jgi:hypothetical protein